MTIPLPALEERRCFKCEKLFSEHNNNPIHWGDCHSLNINGMKSRKRYGVCEGWCRGKSYPFSQLTVHHIVPRRLGGTARQSNLVTLCQPCHDYQEDILNEMDETYLWMAMCKVFPPEARKQAGILKRRFKAQEMAFLRKELFDLPSRNICRLQQKQKYLTKEDS